jgi:Mor family transcriptional regulator
MGYKKANNVLPHTLLCAIQQYIDGEYIYIPRKEDNKLSWGTNTETKKTLQTRNREILTRRLAGSSVVELAEQYFLSTKAIYKILNAAKNS